MARSVGSSKVSTEKDVLVLQDGALGAYQAGAYEALCAAGREPEWVAGISIGAINAALIAGNPPERRVERLREFWDRVSSHLLLPPLAGDTASRKLFNEASAALVASTGAPGFFDLRYLPPLLMPPGTLQALSLYDTTPLRNTLLELVDFEILNSGKVHFSVGAVEVATGNQVYFDNTKCTIGPQHIMASGALPPGFPPIEVDGKLYWDGGIVSNTPLQYIFEGGIPRTDMCIFQVDLFSARGTIPETLFDVQMREKEIRYSSRTRLNTDISKLLQELRRAVRRVGALLPVEISSSDDWKLLAAHSCNAAITIVHLIHRRAVYSTQSNDYEFSRYTINEHWAAGMDDVKRTFAHPAWVNRKKPEDGLVVLDLTKELAPPPPPEVRL